jgi:hypothetical protein
MITSLFRHRRSLNLINMLVKRIGNPIFGFAPVKLLNKYERWRGVASILRLSPAAKTRLEWFIYYETKAKNNASLTCRYYGIKPKTFYKWKKRFDSMNLRLLED